MTYMTKKLQRGIPNNGTIKSFYSVLSGEKASYIGFFFTLYRQLTVQYNKNCWWYPQHTYVQTVPNTDNNVSVRYTLHNIDSQDCQPEAR